MREKELTIRQVENGYIATINNDGEGIFKSRIFKGTHIFLTIYDLASFMTKFYGEEVKK